MEDIFWITTGGLGMLSIVQPLLTTGLGALVKIISWWIQHSSRERSTRDLIVLQGFKAESVAKLQGGNDTADPFTRATRRVIALAITGTFCYIIIYLLQNPANVPIIELIVPQKIPMWWKIFGILPKTEQTTIQISFLTLYMMSFKVIMEFLAGFYFVKMGK